MDQGLAVNLAAGAAVGFGVMMMAVVREGEGEGWP